MALSLHASAAVGRSLHAIAQRIGVTVDEQATDQLHHTGPQFEYRRAGELLATLPCPVAADALARLMQQYQAPALPPLDHGWMFDATARQLTRASAHLALTEKEALLLAALLRHAPGRASRDSLLREVWSMQNDIETHTLETHIYRLRHKLAEVDPRPCDIITVDGAYQLQLGSLA